jgi:pimeloyl-ACP methyl ester carboxylesterase
MMAVDFPLYEKGAPYHNVDSLTQHVIGRLDHEGVSKAVFFGNSMGGQIALNLAATVPDRVAGLVLTGSAGLLERSLVNNHTPMKPSRDWIRNRVREVFYDKVHASDALVEEVLEVLSTTRNKLRLVKLARALRNYSMRELLPRIAAPTLLVWGKQDTITPVEAGEQFASYMPNARMYVLDQCGHAPNIEKADAFNKLADAFLEEIGYH